MNIAKKIAGIKALNFLESGMCVGLGTGTTILYFIEALAEKKDSLKVDLLATSKESFLKAREKGLSVFYDDFDFKRRTIDIAIDGADEITEHNYMIKGGGGALLREKIIETSAKKLVILVDETKGVPHLGKFPLPLEISSFLPFLTEEKLLALGFKGAFRKNKETGNLFITENHNLIYDLEGLFPLEDPFIVNTQLKAISGVLETGLFLMPVFKKIIGYRDGSCQIV